MPQPHTINIQLKPFFQTILMNSDDPKISAKLYNGSSVFMLWKNEFIAHPEILTTKYDGDVKALLCLFARKFNMDKNPDIFNFTDNNILNHTMAGPASISN